MTIGVSLPLSYLDSAGQSHQAQEVTSAFGTPGECLTQFKALGVGAIEIQNLGPASSNMALSETAERVVDAGFVLSLHGYLPHATEDPLYEAILPAVRTATDRQQGTILVVHAHATEGAEPAELLASTASALSRLSDFIEAEAYNIKLALEIQRFHGTESPGTTYDGLTSIADKVADHELEFCWDMGHTQSSVIQERLPATPPDAFVQKVIHTHVHGLSPDSDTHWPIIDSRDHIESGVQRLKACGYDGIFNLELYPTRWGTGTSSRDGILGSIRCLREILDRSKGERK